MDKDIGLKFNDWEVIGHVVTVKKWRHRIFNQNKWMCRCKCGNIKAQLPVVVRNGDSRRCRQCCNKARQMKGIVPLAVLSKYKWQANRRQIKFNLTQKYLEKLLVKQDFKCAYTGEPIYFAHTVVEHGKGNSTASLDRINSKLGYEPGNVQWVHKEINKMKMDLQESRFLELCSKVTQWNLS